MLAVWGPTRHEAGHGAHGRSGGRRLHRRRRALGRRRRQTARGGRLFRDRPVNDVDADPAAIRVLGVVVSGSWDGVPLTGALVHIRAFGVRPSSVRGTLLIEPSSDDA
jgi:hypothetical protein